LTPEQLPHIDFVLISHNHFDHLDYNSVKSLQSRYPNATWYVPVGLKKWFKRRRIDNVVEVDWWEQQRVADKLTLVATPTRHWSCRHLWIQNDSLWNSYVILGQKRRLFFAGDTAYCPVFQQIGKQYGPFDISFIPIGSYCPRNVQKSSHIDPTEAVQVHLDVKSKFSIGMHFGTFQMTNEPVFEPIELLQAELSKRNLKEDFTTMKHGQVLGFFDRLDPNLQKYSTK
jgi:N-acyl-phosphatidylethanolamine-hydrolysing phospholipase D